MATHPKILNSWERTEGANWREGKGKSTKENGKARKGKENERRKDRRRSGVRRGRKQKGRRREGKTGEREEKGRKGERGGKQGNEMGNGTGGKKGGRGGKGAPVPTPLHQSRPNLAPHGLCSCQISSELLYCVTLRGKVPQILLRFHIQDSVMAPFSSIKTTSNTGVQLQTFLYPTVSISFPYSNGLMAKLFAQTLPFKGQKINKKQTSNFFTPPPPSKY